MKNNHIGILLIAFVIVAIMTMGGSLSLFYSTPGLIAVLGILIGSLIFKFGFSSLMIWKLSKPLKTQICQFGSSVSVTAGVLATVIGFIQMFAQVSWTDPKVIGSAVSLSLTTILYGFILSLGFKLAAPLNQA